MNSLDFPFAYGEPTQTALFRKSPEDFIVEEVLSEPLSGEGEHLWLQIRKRGENTEWVAKKLSNFFSVRKMDVGYGGKKDRHAVTTQWFSVYLPGQAHSFDWDEFQKMAELDAELLDSSSHSKKLKKGDHEANKFVIRLHEVQLDDALRSRLSAIEQFGVPNYFGEQRFGRGGGNLDRVEAWSADPRSIRDRNLKGLIISSARSYLFNKVLAARVEQNNGLMPMAGEPDDTQATGPMWGRGRTKALEDVLALEAQVFEPYAHWCLALENVGLNQERRKLVLKPSDFEWSFDGDTLELAMTLGTGEYATSVLREVAVLKQPERDFAARSPGSQNANEAQSSEAQPQNACVKED